MEAKARTLKKIKYHIYSFHSLNLFWKLTEKTYLKLRVWKRKFCHSSSVPVLFDLWHLLLLTPPFFLYFSPNWLPYNLPFWFCPHLLADLCYLLTPFSCQLSPIPQNPLILFSSPQSMFAYLINFICTDGFNYHSSIYSPVIFKCFFFRSLFWCPDSYVPLSLGKFLTMAHACFTTLVSLNLHKTPLRTVLLSSSECYSEGPKA